MEIKLKLDSLETKKDLKSLLKSKKRICDLIGKIDGSMLQFHKEIKTREELEEIANSFYSDKQAIQVIKDGNGGIQENKLVTKIMKIKAIISDDIDFI